MSLTLGVLFPPENFSRSVTDVPRTVTLRQASVEVARVLEMPEGSEMHVVMSLSGRKVPLAEQPDAELMQFVHQSSLVGSTVLLNVSAPPEFTTIAPTHLRLEVACYTGASIALDVPPMVKPVELRTQLAERFGLPAGVWPTLYVNGHLLTQSRRHALRFLGHAERAVTLPVLIGDHWQQLPKSSLPRRDDTTGILRVAYTSKAVEDAAAADASTAALDHELQIPSEHAGVRLSALRHAVQALTGVKPRQQYYFGLLYQSADRDPLVSRNVVVCMRPLVRPQRIPPMPVVSCYPRPTDTTSLVDVEIRFSGVPGAAVLHVLASMDASVDVLKAMVRALGVAIPPEHQRYFRFYGGELGWLPTPEAFKVCDFHPMRNASGFKNVRLYCIDTASGHTAW